MLRTYQQELNDAVEREIEQGNSNVLAVMACGGGKTVCMADMFQRRAHVGAGLTMAHRQELTGQMAMTLARAGIYHRIVAPQPTIRFIVDMQVRKLGRSFYHPLAPVAVAGVDTMIRREAQLADFLPRVRTLQVDEGHHLQEANKWGTACGMVSEEAALVAWTATPCRADKKSLRRGAGGLYDAMVVGPRPRELIDMGFLTDYRIFGPPCNIDTSGVEIGEAGDFKANQLSAATRRSRIVGDVVDHYLRIAPGKQGVTFATDVALAQEHCAAFNAAGVPAAVISDRTSAKDRVNHLDAFERREIREIVNVDVLGEGFDCPGIEVVQFARKTASYPLYEQQFCRGMRIMQGKKFAIIIDHVNNVVDHNGPPDVARAMSLEGGARPRGPAEEPVRTCPNPDCFTVFQSWGRTCPACGFIPERQQATRPELVEGNCLEFSPELLASLHAKAEKLVGWRGQPQHLGRGIANKIRDAQHAERQAQFELREAISYWAGVYGSGPDAYIRFYRKFNIDVATAQTLGTPEALKLKEIVRHDIWHNYAA